MSVSDLYDDAVQVNCPVTLENCWCLETVKAPLVWVWHLRIFPLCKISQNVCTSLFWKIIYSKLFKKCTSKHPYQYFVLKFQLFKMYVLNLNCKANFPKPFFVCLFLFLKCQTGWLKTSQPKLQFWLVPQFCQDYTFPFKCLKWSVQEQGPVSQRRLSSKTVCKRWIFGKLTANASIRTAHRYTCCFREEEQSNSTLEF